MPPGLHQEGSRRAGSGHCGTLAAGGTGPTDRDQLRAFEDRYNTTDLNDLLARLDRHTPADRLEESSVTPAA